MRYLGKVPAELNGENTNNRIIKYSVGTRLISLKTSDIVKPPSVFSLFFASYIMSLNLSGKKIADIGTGSGLLAITAILSGANSVYITDLSQESIDFALENAILNKIEGKIIATKAGHMLTNFPKKQLLDILICNAAATPTPIKNVDEWFFYAGLRGRDMIDPLILDSPNLLKPGGKLIFTHSSMANLNESLLKLEQANFTASIVAKKAIKFRSMLDNKQLPVYNRKYLDTIGGVTNGLYTIRNGKPFETLYIIQAIKK